MRPVVVFVSNKDLQCGVHEFGLTIFAAIQSSQNYDFRYVEAADAGEFVSAVARIDPAAVILNWHPGALSWARIAATYASDRPVIAILHDVQAHDLEEMLDEPFDLMLVHEPGLVTSNPYVVSAPRPIPWLEPAPDANPRSRMPGPVRVGSFGFPAKDKNFPDVVEAAQDAFDDCVVRLHLPLNSLWDRSEATGREVIDECRTRLRKPGVTLEVSQAFLPRQALLRELAKNDINVLLYDADRGHGGISAAADVALASGRPLALRRGKMFRNYEGATTPSIYVEDQPLAAILRHGTAPLRPLREAWSARHLLLAYERALDELLGGGGRGAAEVLLVGPPSRGREDQAGDELRSRLARATGLSVRAAAPRSGPDLMRTLRGSGAGLVVVDWRPADYPWLNWGVLAKLGRPAIALADPGTPLPTRLPFAATVHRAEAGNGEAGGGLAEAVAVIRGLRDGGRGTRGSIGAMSAEQVAFIAATSIADHGAALRVRHKEAADRLQLLWNAVHAQRTNAESWQARAGEIFNALEHTTASRDEWKAKADELLADDLLADDLRDAPGGPPSPSAG